MGAIIIPFDFGSTPRELLEPALAKLPSVSCGKHPGEKLQLDTNRMMDTLAWDYRLMFEVEYDPCPVCPYRTGETRSFWEWYSRKNTDRMEFAHPVHTCPMFDCAAGFRAQRPDFSRPKKCVSEGATHIEADKTPNELLQDWLAGRQPVVCQFATDCPGAETRLATRSTRLWLSPTSYSSHYDAIGGNTELGGYELEAEYFTCPACALAEAGVPPVHCHSAFDRFRLDPPEIAGHLAKCRKYAAGPRGFLLMLGSVGTGKTYLAVAIMRAFPRQQRMLFITHADFLRRHRLTYAENARGEAKPEDIRRICQKVALLVFDDLGRRSPGRDDESLLYDLFNYRYSHYLPTIITSNLTKTDLNDLLGTAMFDRMRQACFALLEFNFPSKRLDLNNEYLGH